MKLPSLGQAEMAELNESCKKCGSQSHSAEQCPMNKMARGLDRSVVPPAKACMMGENDKHECPHCGGEGYDAGKPGLYRCKRCKKTFGDRTDPLMGESIVRQLLNEYPGPEIDPNQSELPMPYSGNPTTLSRSLAYRSPHPGEEGPWGRIVQRAREKRQAEEERMNAEREQAKYRTAMTRPKAYGMMTRPKADVMPGGGSMQIGDTTAIGVSGGGGYAG